MSRKCFITGCHSGYDYQRLRNKRLNKKNPAMFTVPKNNSMFQIWQQVIPRSDRKLRHTDRVCELHFAADDIVKYYETTCHDGQVFRLERGRAILKADAIPTIFPKLPGYSSSLQRIVAKMKRSEKYGNLVTERQIELDLAIESEVEKYYLKSPPKSATSSADETDGKNGEEDENVKEFSTIINELFREDNSQGASAESQDADSNDMDSADCMEDRDLCGESVDTNEVDINVNVVDKITFDQLQRNAMSISKPNSSWLISSNDKYVVCAKCKSDRDRSLEKIVAIGCDLNVKVFLDGKEDLRYKDLVISDISDVSTLLYLIDN